MGSKTKYYTNLDCQRMFDDDDDLYIEEMLRIYAQTKSMDPASEPGTIATGFPASRPTGRSWIRPSQRTPQGLLRPRRLEYDRGDNQRPQQRAVSGLVDACPVVCFLF